MLNPLRMSSELFVTSQTSKSKAQRLALQWRTDERRTSSTIIRNILIHCLLHRLDCHGTSGFGKTFWNWQSEIGSAYYGKQCRPSKMFQWHLDSVKRLVSCRFDEFIINFFKSILAYLVTVFMPMTTNMDRSAVRSTRKRELIPWIQLHMTTTPSEWTNFRPQVNCWTNAMW